MSEDGYELTAGENCHVGKVCSADPDIAILQLFCPRKCSPQHARVGLSWYNCHKEEDTNGPSFDLSVKISRQNSFQNSLGSLEGPPRDESGLEVLDPVAEERKGFLRLGERVVAFPEHVNSLITKKCGSFLCISKI